MTTIKNNKMWICPYNPAHVMPNNQRTQRHLSKCRKTYAGKEKAPCPFNALHVVPKFDLQSHIMDCPDKIIVERELVHVMNPVANHGDLRGVEMIPNELEHPYQEEGGEVWDSSNPGNAGYDPSDNVKNRPIMRAPKPAVGKATQKKFREKDIRRLEQIDRGEAPDTDSEEEEEKVVPKRPSLPRAAPRTFPDENGLFNPVYNSKGSAIIGEIEPNPLPRRPKKAPAGRGALMPQDARPETSDASLKQSIGRSASMKINTSPEPREVNCPEASRVNVAGRGKVVIRSPPNQMNRPNEYPRATQTPREYPSLVEAAYRSNDSGNHPKASHRPNDLGNARSNAIVEGQFEDAPEVRMNDLSGRDGKSVYQINLAKIRKITALLTKKDPLTPEEQELVDSLDKIYEEMEKLNI